MTWSGDCFRAGFVCAAVFLPACTNAVESSVETGERGRGGGDVAATAQALETASDRPVAAAVEVRRGSARDLWVFACDVNHRLQWYIRFDSQTAWAWQGVLDTTCRSVPSIGKWELAGRDAIALYGRYSDNHLWELYWPDSNDRAQRFWFDVSNDTGFGAIAGTPVVANVGSGGEISVVVAKGTRELYTLDFTTRWIANKVINSGSTPIKTTNTVSAQRSPGTPYITGRGLTGSDADQTGWIARRTGWTGSYTLFRTLGGADGTLVGTPGINGGQVVAAFRSGTKVGLQFRAATATNNSAWTGLGFPVAGSPIVRPDYIDPPTVGMPNPASYARSPSGLIMYCPSVLPLHDDVAFDAQSAPALVVGGNEYRFHGFFKGPDNKLTHFEHLDDGQDQDLVRGFVDSGVSLP